MKENQQDIIIGKATARISTAAADFKEQKKGF